MTPYSEDLRLRGAAYREAHGSLTLGVSTSFTVPTPAAGERDAGMCRAGPGRSLLGVGRVRPGSCFGGI